MPSFGQNLGAYQANKIGLIEDLIGAERKKHITVIYGQDMLYTAKYEEARDYMLDPAAAQPGDFPLIEAEVGVTADDIEGVAQVILNLRAQWKLLSGPMEALRISTTGAIKAATTRSEIDAIVTQFEQAIATT